MGLDFSNFLSAGAGVLAAQNLDQFGYPSDEGEAIFGQATEDAPPPSDFNFPGGEMIRFGAESALDWAANPGGDLQPANFEMGIRTTPSLGTSPRVIPRSQAGGGVSSSAVLAQASANAGFRIDRKTLFYMLRRWGVDAVVQLTKLSAQALLWLWMTRSKRGSRGPHLRTVVKRVQQGRRYERLLSRYAHQVRGRSGGHRRRRSPAPFRRRRRRK